MRKELSSLQALSAAQGGVVTRQQALVHGVSYASQRRRLNIGEWREHFGCLVVDRSSRGGDWLDAAAVTLRFGPRTIITGPTALRLHGLDVPDSVVVAVVPRSVPRLDGVRVLRDTVARAIVGTPIFTYTMSTDALVDTLPVLPKRRAQHLLDTALQRHWISVAGFGEIIERRRLRGRRGHRILDEMYQWAKAGTRSEAERRAWPLLQQVTGVRWIANYPVVIDGRVVAEGDFASPEHRLIIEIDGRAYHSDRQSFERDRARQNVLVLAGWTVLRFTWEQITGNPEAVIAQVRAAVRRCAA